MMFPLYGDKYSVDFEQSLTQCLPLATQNRPGDDTS